VEPGCTTVVGVEVATPEPAELVAVSTTRIVLPTSAAPSVYVELEAPETALQLAPAESQLCH
jgi:hypothetical protein